MYSGANLKTTAALAGHSSTRHTEKYAHVVDDLKRKAVDALPEMRDIYKANCGIKRIIHIKNV